MSNVSVSLSSLKHLVLIQGVSPELVEVFKRENYPVCVVEMGLAMFGYGTSLEKEELRMAIICQNMARTVYIDSNKRYVFIGENPKIPDSALVEYTDEIHQQYSDSFFTQWDALHCLILYFNTFGMKGEPTFCIKGFWALLSHPKGTHHEHCIKNKSP
jgi:hypothetical protein